MEGSGRLLVAAVGPNSQAGIIFTLLQGANKKKKKKSKKSKKGKKGAKRSESTSTMSVASTSGTRDVNSPSGECACGQSCSKQNKTIDENKNQSDPDKRDKKQNSHDEREACACHDERPAERGDACALRVEGTNEACICSSNEADGEAAKKRVFKKHKCSDGCESDDDDDENDDDKDDDDDDDDETGGMGTKRPSVLKKKLSYLAVRMGYGGLVLAALTALILIARFSIEQFAIWHYPWSWSYLSTFIRCASVNTYSHALCSPRCPAPVSRPCDVCTCARRFVIIGVTVLVIAVPEGLPLAITLALAFSVRRMLHDHNLVRHLDACETMGNATAICSDKTGTLTTNRYSGRSHLQPPQLRNEYITMCESFTYPALAPRRMTVVQAYLLGTHHVEAQMLRERQLPGNYCTLLKQAIAINSAYTSKVVVCSQTSFAHCM